MTGAQKFTAKHGAVLLIVTMASVYWIADILRWTVGYGKVPGYYLAAWINVAWIFCMLATPIVSLLLAVRIIGGLRERLTVGFCLAIFYGLSPAAPFLAYYTLNRGVQISRELRQHIDVEQNTHFQQPGPFTSDVKP